MSTFEGKGGAMQPIASANGTGASGGGGLLINLQGADGIEKLDVAASPQQLVAEKEEAKALMLQFLKGVGLSTALSRRVVKKSAKFVDHLLSILHTRYHLRYATGRELTTPEIQGTLHTYLEALATQHGDELVNFIVHFPDTPPETLESYGKQKYSSGKLGGGGGCGGMVDMNTLTLDGNFRPAVSYALSLSLSLEDLQFLARRCPGFIHCNNPQKKMEPVINYFLSHGISKAGILKIMLRRPQVFMCSLEDNLKPTMLYLESLGLDKSQWPRILVHFPALVTYGKTKIQEAADFLHDECTLSSKNVGYIISRFPHVVSYSVEEKLRPTIDFLRGIGVTELNSFLRKSPQVLGYSVDGNIKPTIRFLIELGYTYTEVVTIINKFPPILGLAINSNIKPKWDYYAETGWPKAHLVAFPQYFGYSLETRIKPRFKEVMRHGAFWSPNHILSSSDKEFGRLLRNHIKEVGAQSLKMEANVHTHTENG